MKLTITLSKFLSQEDASPRLFNQLANLMPLGGSPKGRLTLSQFIDQWPLDRLRKEVYGFGPKAQAELLEILERHNSCQTGRRYADYCASLLPKVARPASDRTCVYCGCTDSRACFGGCFWIVTFQFGNAGVCSNCIVTHRPLAAVTPEFPMPELDAEHKRLRGSK